MTPAEMMTAYRAGDASAFRALHAHVAPRLLAWLRRLAPDAATAEDVAQLTFLKVHRAAARFDDGADPVPWIFAIAHRTCIDEVRRTWRTDLAHPLDERDGAVAGDGGLGAAAGASPGPGDGRFDDEDAAAVRRALGRIPAPYREAIQLTKIEGLGFAEAAARLGASAGAVRVRAHRGYERLREELRGHDLFAERFGGGRAAASAGHKAVLERRRHDRVVRPARQGRVARAA